MKVVFRSSFERDAKKAPARIQHELAKLIESVVAARQLEDIPKVKKMVGHKNAYRIRIEDHRAGFFYENETVEFVRFLQRKSIYKKFP